MDQESINGPRSGGGGGGRQWKKRLGFGRKGGSSGGGGSSSGKPLVALKANGNDMNTGSRHATSSNASIPPDDGDARALRRQAKKSFTNNAFFKNSFHRRNKNKQNNGGGSVASVCHLTVDTESRDDGPQRTTTTLSARPSSTKSKVGFGFVWFCFVGPERGLLLVYYSNVVGSRTTVSQKKLIHLVSSLPIVHIHVCIYLTTVDDRRKEMG